MLRKLYHGWWIVIACFFISLLVGGINYFSFTAFFEPIQQEFAWSYTQVSLATSLRGLEMGLFGPLVGYLADRFGSRKLLISGTIVMGVGLVLMSFTQSLPMFYFCILFIGFGSGGCTMVVTMKAVASWFRKDLGLALGVTACGVGAGGIVIPLVVFLIDACGWRLTLVILGIGMLFIGIPLSLVVRDRPTGCVLSTDGSITESSSTSDRKDDSEKTKATFLEIIKQRSFLYLVIVETVRIMVLNTVFTHIMPYLSSIGMSRTASGIVAAALPLVSITGRLGFGWLSDRFDKRMVLVMAISLTSAGMFAFSFVHSFWVLLLFVLLIAPGHGGGMVVRVAILHEYFGMSSFGTLLGILLGFGAIGGIVGPTLAGWVVDTHGSYTSVWYGFSAICAATIFLIMKIKRPLELPLIDRTVL